MLGGQLRLLRPQQPAPPGPGMVLLTQLHCSGGTSRAAAAGSDDGMMLQQAMQVLEQAPAGPLLSPLALCLREQCCSPAAAALAPAPAAAPLPPIPTAAAVAETPTAALLASLLPPGEGGGGAALPDQAALEALLQKDGFIESLLNSLPCTPAVAGLSAGASGASGGSCLTPVVSLPLTGGGSGPAAAASPVARRTAAAPAPGRAAAAAAPSPLLVAMVQPGSLAAAAGGASLMVSGAGSPQQPATGGPSASGPSRVERPVAARTPLSPLLLGGLGSPAAQGCYLLSPLPLADLLR